MIIAHLSIKHVHKGQISTVKNYDADISSVSPSSERKEGLQVMRGLCRGEELRHWWKNGDVNIEIDQLNEKRLLDSESLGCRVGKKIFSQKFYGLLT